MKKYLLMVAIVLGTSVMANAAAPVKATVAKELRTKHPKHRRAKKAKMATEAAKPEAAKTN